MVCVSGGEMSEFLGQSETMSHVFRRHKVFCHLDTAVQVVHLRGKKKKSICRKETNTGVGLFGVLFMCLTWCGAPAGINTASPKNCTMDQPWTPYSS